MINGPNPSKKVTYYTSIGVAIGTCFGIVVGAAFGETSKWIALGLGVGLVIGNRVGAWKQRESKDGDE